MAKEKGGKTNDAMKAVGRNEAKLKANGFKSGGKVKQRGKGAATKGFTSRGPMG